MNYEEGKQKMLDALISQVGFQKMVDLGAEILGNPIFICGTDLHAVAHSNTKNVKDIGWDVVKMSARELGVGVRDACLQEILGSGTIEAVANSEHPVVSSYSFTENRYIGARVCDYGMMIGNVTLIESEKQFTEEDSRLLEVFCKVIAFEMRQFGHPEMQAVHYYGLITDLLNKDMQIGKGDLEVRAKSIGLQFPRKMRLLLFQPESGKTKVQQFHIRTMLLREFSNSIGIVRNSSIVVVVNGETPVSQIHKTLEVLLKYYQLTTGISQVFQDPGRMWIYYMQSKAAIKIGGLLDKEKKIHLFEDVSFLYLAISACEEQPVEMFYSSHLNTLLEYDSVNHTSFAEDLRIYLANGKNIGKAAQKLFIHKNSMYYRISKIEEILGISLKDDDVCITLQLSLELHQCRKYIKEYKER